jgi:hypothetical protein
VTGLPRTPCPRLGGPAGRLNGCGPVGRRRVCGLLQGVEGRHLLADHSAQHLLDTLGAVQDREIRAGQARLYERREVLDDPAVREEFLVACRSDSARAFLVVDVAQRDRANVVLVGDPRQPPEIEAGGAFGVLAARDAVIELVENRRQSQAWERDALNELRSGSVVKADATGRWRIGWSR